MTPIVSTAAVVPIVPVVPVPSEKPGAANTGVPAGVALTAYAGPDTITTPGTVIDAQAITRPLLIAADNVTIRRSAISANNWVVVYVNGGVTGTRFEDVSITGGGGGFCIAGSSLTVVRANISGCGNAIVTSTDTTVENSYIHDNLDTAVGGIYASNVSGIVLRFNTIVAPATASSAVAFSEPAGNTVSNLTISGNWLDGGRYTVVIDAAPVIFQNNRFGHAASDGPKYPFTVNPLTGSGNVWDDTSLPVPGF
jgi:hypothetical protein